MTKRGYTPTTVERAMNLHNVPWMKREDGVYVVTTAIGSREMTLRDAYHFCVGIIFKENQLIKDERFAEAFSRGNA